MKTKIEFKKKENVMRLVYALLRSDSLGCKNLLNKIAESDLDDYEVEVEMRLVLQAASELSMIVRYKRYNEEVLEKIDQAINILLNC